MKKQFLLLILCIGLLLSGCQKTPEPSPAAQPVEPPWETESPDVLPSYTAYFTEIRMYDTADYAYTPAWLQTGDYEIDCIDGKLALFQTSDGERLAVYAEQPFLSWRTGSSGVYVFREQDILHCSYDGSSEETLYAAQDGTIIGFAAAGDVLFFAEKTDNCIRLCRLYAPEERLDILYDAVSPDAQKFLIFPVSNHELCWSMDNPAFLELAAEQKQTYIETRNLDPDDQSTYWGMLELDFDVNSGIRYYYNDLTQELRSQEFRIIYGEEDDADWWKTAAQEETKDTSGIDQYDDAKTWSWAPYETLYRTDGTRMGLVREADGTRHIGEVPDTKIWIRLKDGTLLSDEPFDACIDYMGTPEGEVYCIRNGTGYRYTVSAGDGSFYLSEVDEPKTLEEDHFGYRLRVTRWDSREPCYGIVTADGTEVVAPVYERVEIPFPDCFLLYEGGASQGPVMGRCRLTDENGNTLCARFHWIDYSVFNDGYIGIAVCYGERAAYPCYDKDGQPMPEGYWLVDRDGKLCSERFAKLSFGDSDETHAASEDDVLRVLREDGTEELLPVAELLLP